MTGYDEPHVWCEELIVLGCGQLFFGAYQLRVRVDELIVRA